MKFVSVCGKGAYTGLAAAHGTWTTRLELPWYVRAVTALWCLRPRKIQRENSIGFSFSHDSVPIAVHQWNNLVDGLKFEKCPLLSLSILRVRQVVAWAWRTFGSADEGINGCSSQSTAPIIPALVRWLPASPPPEGQEGLRDSASSQVMISTRPTSPATLGKGTLVAPRLALRLSLPLPWLSSLKHASPVLPLSSSFKRIPTFHSYRHPCDRSPTPSCA